MKFGSLIPLQLVLAAVLLSVGSAQSVPPPASAAQAYGKLPLTFEANQGQANDQVKFLSRGSNYSVFLTSQSMVLALAPSSSPQASTAAPAITPHKLAQASAKQAKPANQSLAGRGSDFSLTATESATNATTVPGSPIR